MDQSPASQGWAESPGPSLQLYLESLDSIQGNDEEQVLHLSLRWLIERLSILDLSSEEELHQEIVNWCDGLRTRGLSKRAVLAAFEVWQYQQVAEDPSIARRLHLAAVEINNNFSSPRASPSLPPISSPDPASYHGYIPQDEHTSHDRIHGHYSPKEDSRGRRHCRSSISPNSSSRHSSRSRSPDSRRGRSHPTDYRAPRHRVSRSRDSKARPSMDKAVEISSDVSNASVEFLGYDDPRTRQERRKGSRAPGRDKAADDHGGVKAKKNQRAAHPSAGYVCNRCGIPGHWIDECDTVLDANYHAKPDMSYVCKKCKKRGVHFLIACPKYSNPKGGSKGRKQHGRDESREEHRAERDEHRGGFSHPDSYRPSASSRHHDRDDPPRTQQRGWEGYSSSPQGRFSGGQYRLPNDGARDHDGKGSRSAAYSPEYAGEYVHESRRGYVEENRDHGRPETKDDGRHYSGERRAHSPGMPSKKQKSKAGGNMARGEYMPDYRHPDRRHEYAQSSRGRSDVDHFNVDKGQREDRERREGRLSYWDAEHQPAAQPAMQQPERRDDEPPCGWEVAEKLGYTRNYVQDANDFLDNFFDEPAPAPAAAPAGMSADPAVQHPGIGVGLSTQAQSAMPPHTPTQHKKSEKQQEGRKIAEPKKKATPAEDEAAKREALFKLFPMLRNATPPRRRAAPRPTALDLWPDLPPMEETQSSASAEVKDKKGELMDVDDAAVKGTKAQIQGGQPMEYDNKELGGADDAAVQVQDEPMDDMTLDPKEALTGADDTTVQDAEMKGQEAMKAEPEEDVAMDIY